MIDFETQFLVNPSSLNHSWSVNPLPVTPPDIIQNSTINFEDEAGPEWFVVPIVFGLIFIIGVLGNGTLILTVLLNSTMRSTPNILLVSLAIGDLLLILISVPFSSTYYTFPEWPYGLVACKLNEFLCSLSLGVSVFTLTALSGERYMVIVYPMSGHRGHPLARTLTIAGAIWVLAAFLGSIELFSAHLNYIKKDNITNITVCAIDPEDGILGEHYGQFHSMFRFLVYFAFPIIIIAFFYARMARILVISSTHMLGDSLKQQGFKQLEARKKVARLVLSFVFVFAVCWLPRHIYFLWYYYDPSEFNMFWHVFKIIGFCLAFINSCVNPLALYFLSRQFRRYYDHYLFCLCAPFCRRRCGKETGSPLNGQSRVGEGGYRLTGMTGMTGTRDTLGAGTYHTTQQKSNTRIMRQPSMPMTAITIQSVC